MVRTVKEYLNVSVEFRWKTAVCRFLLSYRSIPNKTTTLTPSVLMLGREIRTFGKTMTETVYAWTPSGEYQPGELIAEHGKNLVIQLENKAVVRHTEQVKEVTEEHTHETQDAEAKEVTEGRTSESQDSKELDQPIALRKAKRNIVTPARYAPKEC